MGRRSIAILAALFALTALGVPALAVEASRARDPGKVQVKRQDKRLGKAPQAGGLHRKQRKTNRVDLVLFYLLAAGCAGFGLVMITRRSPMMSALSLLVVFLCLAGVYVLLKAPFMAAIQLIVYAGAVIVLFIFVIMSIGIQEEQPVKELASELAYYLAGLFLTAGAAVAFFYGHGIPGLVTFAALELGALVLYVAASMGLLGYKLRYPLTRFLGTAAMTFAVVQLLRLARLTAVFPGKTPDEFGSAKSVGYNVFRDNVFAFEALSLLLLAAIVAAVVIVRSRKEPS